MTTPPTKSLALELAARLERAWYSEALTRDAALGAVDELRRLDAVESELAALKEALRGLEPVAWLATDQNAEKYLCFHKRFTDDSFEGLYTLPPNLKG